MNYGSVCSGIEAASVAWEPLGCKPQFFSEIEAFPSAVLRHHWPDVPNLGDMTNFKEWPDAAIDILVGGTPCQSFSVAGLRKGLDDPRGNLALTYLAIAERYRPRWLVWENVPGVLSSNRGGDFGAFLGGLGKLGYGWAYRVLDAQYFGVAQRRRRVFVVGYLGSWQRAAAVLFERHSLQGHPAPSRSQRESASPDAGGRIDCSGKGISGDVSRKWAKGTDGPSGDEHYNLAAIPLLEPGARTGKSTTDPRAGIGVGDSADPMFTLQAGKQHGVCAVTGDIAHALNTANNGKGCSEDGTGRGVPTIAFSAKDYGADARDDLSPTLRAGGHSESHPNAGVMPAVCFVQNSRSEVRQVGGDGQVTGAIASAPGVQQQHYVAQPVADTLTSHWHKSGGAVAGKNEGVMNPVFSARQVAQTVTQNYGKQPDNSDTSMGPNLAIHGLAVRRLTPTECERLQGFPDGHTAVPYRNKLAADGPRYKAIGNSMAVPVMRWIGARIQQVDSLPKAAH